MQLLLLCVPSLLHAIIHERTQTVFSLVATILMKSEKKMLSMYPREPIRSIQLLNPNEDSVTVGRKPASLSWVHAKNALRDENSPTTSLKAHINRIGLYVSVWISYYNFSFFQLLLTIWANSRLFRHFFTSLNHLLPLLNSFLFITFLFKLSNAYWR